MLIVHHVIFAILFFYNIDSLGAPCNGPRGFMVMIAMDQVQLFPKIKIGNSSIVGLVGRGQWAE